MLNSHMPHDPVLAPKFITEKLLLHVYPGDAHI